MNSTAVENKTFFHSFNAFDFISEIIVSNTKFKQQNKNIYTDLF